ncbi:hypothetical protein Tco_1231750 [Tanacetum coccineum]
MTVTPNSQDLLALIQTHEQMIMLIQTHQALLAKIGYTRTNNIATSTSNVHPATVTPSAYHTGPVQLLVGYTSPPGFSQLLYGPNQFHHQSASHAQAVSKQSGSFEQMSLNQFICVSVQQPNSGQQSSSVGHPG